MSSKKVGIVCTIGPQTASQSALIALSESGMTLARLNGSHADLDWHRETIALIRKTLPDTPILLDIPGRKIRTVQLPVEPHFGKGDDLTFTTDAEDFSDGRVPINNAQLHTQLSAGDTILADDGTLSFTVKSVSGRDILCTANCAGQIKSRKGINVPHVRFDADYVTARDEVMLTFARDNQIDYIGVSFVESSVHVRKIREFINDTTPRIVAKIENQGGLANMRDVISESDAIMIDRGDLSVETALHTVALDQKRIIAAATDYGKPVIVATEMLHTMIENPFPTKAEVSDITNAVLDGCAATMLSGETAVGTHYIEATTLMRDVARTAVEYRGNPAADAALPAPAVSAAMEDAVALISHDHDIDKIVAVTISGYAARMIAARRPRQEIIAVSNDPRAARAMNLLYGTIGIHVDIPFSKTSTDHIAYCLETLWRSNRIASRDRILVTSVGYPKSGNRMNLIQIHRVNDLVEALGWTRD